MLLAVLLLRLLVAKDVTLEKQRERADKAVCLSLLPDFLMMMVRPTRYKVMTMPTYHRA